MASRVALSKTARSSADSAVYHVPRAKKRVANTLELAIENLEEELEWSESSEEPEAPAASQVRSSASCRARALVSAHAARAKWRSFKTEPG